jgi:maltose O-acetyltransferase
MIVCSLGPSVLLTWSALALLLRNVFRTRYGVYAVFNSARRLDRSSRHGHEFRSVGPQAMTTTEPMGSSLLPITKWKRRAERFVSAASAKRAKLSDSSGATAERLGLRRMVAVAVNEWGDIDFRRLALGIVLAPLPDAAFPRLRVLVYRLLGIRIGRSTLIRGRLKLAGPPGCTSRFTIGSNCFLTTPLHIDLNSEVVIGNHVTIGHDVAIVTSAHHIGGPGRRCGQHVPRPIRIGDGCWIGARALLLPGVILGDGSIIAAGAVVSSNVEPHTIVGGVPARLIRRLG